MTTKTETEETDNTDDTGDHKSNCDGIVCAIIYAAYFLFIAAACTTLFSDPISRSGVSREAIVDTVKTAVNNLTLAGLALSAAGGLVAQGLQLVWDEETKKHWRLTLIALQWPAASI